MTLKQCTAQKCGFGGAEVVASIKIALDVRKDAKILMVDFVEVSFEIKLRHWDAAQIAKLCFSFKLPTCHDGNTLIGHNF